MSVITLNKKKFAVLVGINYTGTSSQLQGCINDVNHIKDFLINKCDYPPQNIYILCDTIQNKPTKKNILAAFDLLIKKSQEGYRELWFSYSGHGSYVSDTNGDENDKRDEVLCPLDYSTSGFITDDDIYSNFLTKLPVEVTLFGLIDSCHSGSIFDLQYLYNTTLMTNNNKKCAATVITISGCRDDQTSADAYINKNFEGAMTWSFLLALSNNNYKPIQLVDLVKKMRDLLKPKYSQVPLLGLSSPTQLSKYFF